MRHLIIGGGISGTTAAEELRKLDPTCEITLLSAEQHRCYSRVLLPHYLKNKVPRERVFLKKPEWYSEQKIEWLPGVLAERIDVTNRFVLASDGREYPFDRLLIASGGEVRTLSPDPRGVSYLRTLDDADHLWQLLSEQKHQRAAVVGGGFISLEYINLFVDCGIQVDLFARGQTFFGRSLDSQSMAILRAKCEAEGVTFHDCPDDFAFVGDQQLSGVSCAGETFPVTIAGVGIGITPDLHFAKDIGLIMNPCIDTNEYLETGIADVYAAGDVACFTDTVVGRKMTAGNWLNAMQQGRTVAHSMSGTRTAFAAVGSYATNCRGIEVIFIGDTDRTAADQVDVDGSVESGGVVQRFLRKGKLVGATLVNRNKERAALTAEIRGASF